MSRDAFVLWYVIMIIVAAYLYMKARDGEDWYE